MRTKQNQAAWAALISMVGLCGPAQAQLLVNGGFEASSSNFVTPTSWFNIGHTEGVLRYEQVPTQPVAEGLNFYTIGGVSSNGFANIGEGIGQTFATLAGASYRVSYSYSGENVPGAATETLRVSAAGAFIDHVLVPTGSPVFTRPWTAATLNFTATGSTTTLSFILSGGIGQLGNNDPMIDAVSVVLTAVPEPATSATLLAGVLALAAARRQVIRAQT